MGAFASPSGTVVHGRDLAAFRLGGKAYPYRCYDTSRFRLVLLARGGAAIRECHAIGMGSTTRVTIRQCLQIGLAMRASYCAVIRD